MGKDPRPSNYKQWVRKYRKVDPIDLVANRNLRGGTYTNARTALSTGLDTYTGDWNEHTAAHLLRRALFGVRKAELSIFKNLTTEEAVAEILQANTFPDPPVNDYYQLDEGIDDPYVEEGSPWLEAPYDVTLEGGRVISLKGWTIKNILKQEPTIHEKMILFWHNLLVTKVWDVFIGKASYQYVKMLRENALGNFRALIKKLTLDPSMLLFLNGAWNNKEAPDENYARELQELFCIGKGPEAKFTEGDVQAAARVLTGWTLNWDDFSAGGVVNSNFNPWLHETSDKQFSEFYGNKLIVGRAGEQGAEELDELLDMIFDNDETALYICRRLYNFFVYHEVDEEAEDLVIKPLSEIFRQNNYEIQPVLKKLLESEHFYDVQNRGVMIKNPADFLLGTFRTLEVPNPYEGDLPLTLRFHSSLLWTMANGGMEMCDPPNVSGWPAYYQAPQYDKSWINTDTISSRAISTDSLIYWGFWVDEGHTINADLVAFLQQLDHPEDPELMLREASLLLMGVDISDELIGALKNTLLSGQSTEGYWTLAWNALMNNPENGEYRLVVENRLKVTFQQLMQLAEFQLM